ncbi:MAG: hypothetical protein HY925_04610 [Elusimicrobia bacterium]|nr:hypothetical protein [Elusimicrobiota bacterium]
MIPAWALCLILGLPAVAQERSALAELKLLGAKDLPPVPLPLSIASTWNIPKEVIGERVDGVLVVGERAFIEATRAALAIVKRSSFREEVLGAVGRIEQAPCSGMDPSLRQPTFHVGEPTWRADPLWYAGAIAHDSRHSQLYAAALKKEPGLEPRPDSWKGDYGERAALAYQIRFLSELKATRERLDYLRGLQMDPTYHELGTVQSEQPFDRARRAYYTLNCRGRHW